MSAHPILPSEAVLKKDFVELGLSDVQADIVHKYLTQTLGLLTEEDTNNESNNSFRGNEVYRNSSIPMQVQFKRTNVQGHVDFGDSSEIRGLKFADEVYVNIHAWFIRKQCPLENPHLYFVRGLVVKVKTLEPRHHSRITIYFDSLDKAILKLHQYGMLSEVTTSEIDKSRQYLEEKDRAFKSLPVGRGFVTLTTKALEDLFRAPPKSSGSRVSLDEYSS